MNHCVVLSDFTEKGHFGPLTRLISAGELRCGKFELRSKTRLRFAVKGMDVVTIDPISPLAIDLAFPKFDINQNANFLISSRAILSGEAIDRILQSGQDERFITPDGKTVGFHFEKSFKQVDDIGVLPSLGTNFTSVVVNAKRIDFPWHLDKENSEEIGRDLQLSEQNTSESIPNLPGEVIVRGKENLRASEDFFAGPGAIFCAEKNRIRLESGVNISAGAILDSSKGPIWVDEKATIEPGAIIQGPAYIGQNSIIRAGAKLNGSVSLGPYCRVGGELSGVIMQGYSNKQHSGYLGGAVIGQWVNLGAATDNSDLKNNYRPVDVVLDGQSINSGELHAGVYLGDFVRSAIHTRLNTGTVIDTCCNLFGNDFPDKAVPPFVWFGSDGYQEYRLDKALETIDVILSRRGRSFGEELVKGLTQIFDATSFARKQFIEGH